MYRQYKHLKIKNFKFVALRLEIYYFLVLLHIDIMWHVDNRIVQPTSNQVYNIYRKWYIGMTIILWIMRNENVK